jgi:hypothetical protein
MPKGYLNKYGVLQAQFSIVRGLAHLSYKKSSTTL